VSGGQLRKVRAEADISIPFRTKADAVALTRALVAEVRASRRTRASVRVNCRGKDVRMRFSASDLVALRALVNSFLRSAAVWSRVSDIINQRHGARRHRNSQSLPA